MPHYGPMADKYELRVVVICALYNANKKGKVYIFQTLYLIHAYLIDTDVHLSQIHICYSKIRYNVDDCHTAQSEVVLHLFR